MESVLSAKIEFGVKVGEAPNKSHSSSSYASYTSYPFSPSSSASPSQYPLPLHLPPSHSSPSAPLPPPPSFFSFFYINCCERVFENFYYYWITQGPLSDLRHKPSFGHEQVPPRKSSNRISK